MFDEFFKILSFYSKGNILKGTYPKTYNFGPFLGPIYPRKIRTIGKNQNFFKNCIFRTMKQHYLQVHKNHRFLINLVKHVSFLGLKSDLNYFLVLAQRVNTNSHIGYNNDLIELNSREFWTIILVVNVQLSENVGHRQP